MGRLSGGAGRTRLGATATLAKVEGATTDDRQWMELSALSSSKSWPSRHGPRLCNLQHLLLEELLAADLNNRLRAAASLLLFALP